jgi:hypothetical protein
LGEAISTKQHSLEKGFASKGVAGFVDFVLLPFVIVVVGVDVISSRDSRSKVQTPLI